MDKNDSLTADAVILDGAAIVNMLKPGTAPAHTFSEYAAQIFLPYVASQQQHAHRVDLVWDEYTPISLNTYTGSKRGKGSPGIWNHPLHFAETSRSFKK